MATVVNGLIVARSRGAYTVTWSFPSGNITASDVGTGFDGMHLPDKTVQVFGPTGGTTQVTLEGSMFSSGPFANLHDPSNNDLVFTNAASGLVQVLENPRYVRPKVNTVTTGFAHTITVVVSAQSGRR